MFSIFLNGKYIGETSRENAFINSVKEMRLKGKLPIETNITFNGKDNSIMISTDKGRARRPLIIVKNGKSLLTKEVVEALEKNEMEWNDLVSSGVVEYLDAHEEENSYIALNEEDLTQEHTHLELSPTIVLGPHANLVPFLHNSLSFRVILGAKMSKQALGLYAANMPIRFDTDANIIQYPQIPVVKTEMYNLINFENHPCGQNVVVAVMPYMGYNMEDAIVINRASIDRGLFRVTNFKQYKCEELKYPGGQSDEVKIPDKDIKGYRTDAAYKYLEEDGIIQLEADVTNEDVIVGKISPPRFLASLEEFRVGTEAQRETSTIVTKSQGATVDSVLVSESEDGNRFIKVRLREQRLPDIGDKFASRHGQKGIVGLIIPEEDMPHTVNGIVPDIIFSHQGIPSRLTIGHLIELLGGKAGALKGEYVDSTAFQSMNEEQLRKWLVECGFKDDGTEAVIDGRTGQLLNARILVGGQYYYRLVYMVSGKMHSRSTGPVQLLTRQPTEGRAKEGGLRLGEMEKDCFVAHGAAMLLKERFDSDRTILPVCKECGLVAIYNRFKNKEMCPVCGEHVAITFVEMSYAFKLLLDELKSLCIYPKLNIVPKY